MRVSWVAENRKDSLESLLVCPNTPSRQTYTVSKQEALLWQRDRSMRLSV